MIILMNGALEFNSADIEQMAGRGNRSQGTSSAHVFLCSLTKGKSIEAILSTNNSKVVTEAATWLKNLFERYKELPVSEKPKTAQAKFRNKVVQALANGKWLTHHDQIDKDVKDWLQGANYQA